MLSGSIAGKLSHTGVLQVWGTTDADVINIVIVKDRIRPGSAAAGYNDETFLGIPFGTRVKRVRVDLSSGDDRLSIKSSVGAFADGKSGKDSITIDARRATLHGGSGNDTLRSIASNMDATQAAFLMKRENLSSNERPEDFDVFAGTFNTLEGGPGNDILYSRGGDDLLAGGSGFDRFIGASDDITIYNSRYFPFGRAAVVTVWESNALVVEVEQSELLSADRPVRAYF